MGNGHPLDLKKAMGAAMHPAAVMGLHLQGVDECLLERELAQVLGESLVAVLLHHRHHIRRIAQACGALDVRQDLRVVGPISDPAHLGPLHGVPEAHALDVIAPGLAVVRQPLGEGPLPHSLKADRLQSGKGPQAVVSHQCFGGDRRPSAHQLVVL